jgi:hypothetical protein
MADKKPLSPEAQRIYDARLAAVAELKAIDGKDRVHNDPAVLRLSTARMYESAITMRVLAGEKIASSEIEAASRLVENARGAVPEPCSVTVTFVGGPGDSRCPQCGWQRSQTMEEAQLEARERARVEDEQRAKREQAPTIDGEAIEVGVQRPEPKRLPSPARSSGNDTPKARDNRVPKKQRSIHDGNAPLRADQQSGPGSGIGNFMGGFSSGRDSFGQSRWPNPDS